MMDDRVMLMPERKAKTVRLIGAASCWGAQKSQCALGPDVVRDTGIALALNKAGLDITWKAVLHPNNGEENPVQSVPLIADLCERLSEQMFEIINRGERFCVIGGDHSCAVGTWSGVFDALQPVGPLGLIWIDAHMDSHTPETSPSGALHGMPLACLLGYGHKALCELRVAEAKLRPQHVCLIGVRSFEPEEQALLERLGVRVFYMHEVKSRGLDTVMTEAVEQVSHGTCGFGLTIDVDAVDPKDAPGVGSPVPEGIEGEALVEVLTGLSEQPQFVGAEIAELNPMLDNNNKTTKLVTEMIRTLFA